MAIKLYIAAAFDAAEWTIGFMH